MPIIYQIDPARYFIHTRCVGDVTLEDARNFLQTLQADPMCPASLNVLLDLTAAASVPGRDGYILIGGEIGRVRGIRFNACAIYTTNNHLYGMARMFAALVGNRFAAMHVFRTLDNARKWLDSFPMPVG